MSAESCLIVRECFVVEHCSGAIQGNGVVFALADVDSDEDGDVVVVLDGGDHSVLRSMNDSTAAVSCRVALLGSASSSIC